MSQILDRIWVRRGLCRFWIFDTFFKLQAYQHPLSGPQLGRIGLVCTFSSSFYLFIYLLIFGRIVLGYVFCFDTFSISPCCSW